MIYKIKEAYRNSEREVDFLLGMRESSDIGLSFCDEKRKEYHNLLIGKMEGYGSVGDLLYTVINPLRSWKASEVRQEIIKSLRNNGLEKKLDGD